MKRIAIKEICKVFDGPHATPTKTEKGPVYLGIDAITETGALDATQFSHLSEEDYIKWTKRVVPQEDDIVFSYEATLGRYAMIPKGFYGCLGRRLAIIRNVSEDINTRWLYYYFRSPEWASFIKNQTVKGSTVDRISVEDFPEYTIPLISRKDQDAIVAVLDCIDRKIAGNDKINDYLEEMAKTIYDYWFVQFDFPDESGKPYMSSGGKMEYSEELGFNIPKGWKVLKLGQVCECLLGGTPSRDKEEYWGGKINWINSGEVNSFRINHPSEMITELGLKNTSTYLLPKNTVVLAITGATMGQVSIVNIDTCANQSVIGIKETASVPTEFIYFMILNTMKKLLNQKAGAAQPHINKNNVQNIIFALPPVTIMDAYLKKIQPVFKQITCNEKQNVFNTDLRDWLLPILMNGQATIDD